MKSAPRPSSPALIRSFNRCIPFVALMTAFSSFVISARAATYAWDAGGGGTTTWSTATNWTGDAVPTFAAGDLFDLSTLNIAAASTSTMDTAQTLGGIILGDTNNTHAWTLSLSAGLTLNGNGSPATISQVSTSKGDTISGTGAIALASDLTLANASANTLTLANALAPASGTQTVTNSGTGTGAVVLGGVLSGNLNIVQDSLTSRLSLSPATLTANTYTGTITIKAGDVLVSRSGPIDGNYTSGFGASTNVVTLGDASGAATSITLGYRANVANPISVTGGGTHTLSFTHTNSGQVHLLSGLVTLNSNDLTLSVTGISGVRISGGITGTGNVIVNNTNTSGNGIDFRTTAINNTGTISNISTGTVGISQGTATSFGANVTSLIQNSATAPWNLNQANGNFAGTVQVLAGTLSLNNTASLKSANEVFVGASGTLDVLQSNTIAGLSNVSGAGGIVTNSDTVNARTLTLGGSGAYSYSGSLTAATAANLALTKSGTGTQTLSGNNTYDGLTTLSAGTLKIGHANALGSTVGATTLSGGTLDLNGFTIGETVNVTAASTLANTSASAAALSVDANLTNNLAVNTTGDITATRLIGTGAPRTVTKTGAGTLTTNGTSHNNLVAWDVQAGTVVFANTSGYGADRGVTLNGGTLKLSGANSDLVNNGQAFTVNSGVFDLNGKSEAVASVTGSGGFIRNGLASTSSTLFVGGGNGGSGDGAFAGIVENGSGTLAVTKEGSGVQTFTGANTFTGGATVSTGTLATGATGTFGAGNVSVAAAATLTFGNNTSIIDTATLTFASTSTINLNFAGAETVGSVFNSVTSTALAAGTYDAAGLNTFFGVSGFTGTGSLTISAVPEPATYAVLAGFGALGLTAFRRRRTA